MVNDNKVLTELKVRIIAADRPGYGLSGFKRGRKMLDWVEDIRQLADKLNIGRFAWGLGLFWGIMQITNAIIQGFYELVILKWSTACMQTYLFLLVGVIAVVSLLIARKDYFSGRALKRAYQDEY